MATNYPVNVSLEDALTAPLLGFPLENTYIDIDPTFTERNVYLQNKRSLGRLQYKDGQITCTTRGFDRSQVWKMSNLNSSGEDVENLQFKIEIERHVLTVGENGNLQCEEGRSSNLKWKFREVERGMYRLEVGSRALCVRENGDMYMKLADVESIDEGELWTFVPANDCPFVRIQSSRTDSLLTMEEHGEVHAAPRKSTDNSQTWLLIPGSYEGVPLFFYIQNYENGLKLAAVIDDCVKPSNRIVGVNDNANEEQLWNLRTAGWLMEFANRPNCPKLSVGFGDNIDDSWILMPYRVQTVFIKFMGGELEKSNDPFLMCGDINVWSIEHADRYYSFRMRDPRSGSKLAYDGSHFFMTQEPICDNQFWTFQSSLSNEYRFEIGNRKHGYVDTRECYITHAPFGLKDLNGFVYRVCRANENISESITPSAPWSTRTLEQHIRSGSVYKSKFISTTADELHWRQRVFYYVDGEGKPERQEPRRSVKIDLDLVRTDENLARWCINLGNKEVCDSFLRGSTNKSWAASTKEVIFMDPIPRAMYEIIDPENLEKPPRPEGKKWKKGLPDIDELGGMLKRVSLYH